MPPSKFQCQTRRLFEDWVDVDIGVHNSFFSDTVTIKKYAEDLFASEDGMGVNDRIAEIRAYFPANSSWQYYFPELHLYEQRSYSKRS